MLTAVVDLPTPPLPDATAMIASMPGTPRRPGCARRAHAVGARCCTARPGRWRGGAARTGASMPPPFFSAVSATIAPATPGIALTTRSAAARSGVEFLRARGGHGDGEEHLGVGDENIGNQAEADDIALEIRTLDRLQLFDDGFVGNGHASALRAPCCASDSADRRLRQAPGATRAVGAAACLSQKCRPPRR